jgi:ribonuclease Z
MEYFERLRNASIYHAAAEIRVTPIQERMHGLIQIAETDSYRLLAHRLDHPVPTYGYRLEEKAGVTFLPDKLAAAGITGPRIAELRDAGQLDVGGRLVRVEDVSVPREGAVFAFVMDTRPCDGAVELARDAELLVMEATFTAADQDLAREYSHSSSVDAAETARAAGAKRLAMTHFSQRYLNVDAHLDEARAIFPDTIALHDLARVAIPRRRAIPRARGAK